MKKRNVDARRSSVTVFVFLVFLIIVLVIIAMIDIHLPSNSATRTTYMHISHVFLQIEISTETFRTDHTRVRFHFRMCVHVKFQIVYLMECLKGMYVF
jgi:hypothetical protein